MNIPHFVILGSLDQMGQGSGYDIMQWLERKKVNMWIGVKTGSVYHAIKQLEQKEFIRAVKTTREGFYPAKTILETTESGKQYFDLLQEEAFAGIYPNFYGFKLALKFNSRRTNEDIQQFAKTAISKIDRITDQMNHHLAQFEDHSEDYQYDAIFIQHEKLLFEAEKTWISQIIKRLDQVQSFHNRKGEA
ncbi:PadR family transcriptional regulator [Marinicrinis sediminis]|uniref:PadR family transcriptional regulator n=1 Tax=Marinicrinis sediminis TaxID=1652465 RepID=A0ABW5RE59_9BACL